MKTKITLLAFTLFIGTYELSAQRIPKLTGAPITGTSNSNIIDNGSSVVIGAQSQASPVSGEYFSIQNNTNGYNILRMYNNSTAGNAASGFYATSSSGTLNLFSMSSAFSSSTTLSNPMLRAGTSLVNTGTSNGLYIGTTSNSQVSLWTNNTQRVFVHGNGGVVIGDSLSVKMPVGYRLYVPGGILTEKLKVAVLNSADWADYVFEKNYHLKPLEEVSQYVCENKHLPGVPSAQELAQNGGFDVVKMDAKLLEKIEELTLYMIELSKQNALLKEEIEELKNK